MNISTWITKLDAAKDVQSHWREIDGLLARGKRDELVQIARVCAQSGLQQWARRSVFDHLISTLLLTRSTENVETLTRIFVALPASSDEERRQLERRGRAFASMLAQEQATQTLLDLGSWARGDTLRQEFFACCVQELVLRGRARARGLDISHAAVTVLSQHPLGALPLELLEQYEGDFPTLLPRYQINGSGRNFDSSALGAETGEGETRAAVLLNFDAALLQSAVTNWEAESNGMICAGVFGWPNSLDAENFGARVLRACELDATEDVKSVRRASFRDAANALFSAASGGGAYNSGERGAWGRLCFWRSTRALIGSSETDIEKLGELAERCAWFDLSGQSSWFYNIAWDIGVACLRPDGKSVAILCATDTD